MKVRLHKKSADGKLMVELEDNVAKHEDGARALRRLEIEANWFLQERQRRLHGTSLKDSARDGVADFLKKPVKSGMGGKKAATPVQTMAKSLKDILNPKPEPVR